MSFSTDVHRIAKDMETTVEKQAAAIFIDLFSDIIRDTPVDTGRLRGNWQTTKDSPAQGTLDRKGGQGPTAEAQAKITNLGTYYLTNNLPYAERIEYDGWSHTKAPEGMVRINILRLDSIIRKHAR